MAANPIDYRGDTLKATRDIRTRLKTARAGRTFAIVCSEDQVIRLLREITYNDGMIVNRASSDEGVFITVRKI